MNPSTLSSLLTSPETPKASTGNRQETNQISDFEEFLTNIQPDSADEAVKPDAAEETETIAQDEGEKSAADHSLSTSDSIRSEPRNGLAEGTAMVPAHDSRTMTHQVDPEPEDGADLNKAGAPNLNLKNTDQAASDNTIAQQIHLNGKDAGVQNSLHEDVVKSVETSYKKLPISTRAHAEEPRVPDPQTTAGAKGAITGDQPNATDRLVPGTDIKPGTANNEHRHKSTAKPVKFERSSVPDQTTGNLALDDGDNANAPPDVRREASHPMSTLERHLGGHAATLVAQVKSAQSPSGPLPESTRWESHTSHVSDALPLQNSVTNAVQMNARVPLVNVVGAGNSIATVRHSEDKANLQVDTLGDDNGWETRTALQTASNVNPPSTPKMDIAGTVTQQIADAIRRSPDRPIEIALSPIELGRVRMVLSAADAGITVNILAERPETLDLLRRNIDDLGKSFSEIGYEDISFSFQQGDQTADDGPSDQFDTSAFGTDEVSPIDSTLTPPRHTPTLAIAPDGIDMRL